MCNLEDVVDWHSAMRESVNENGLQKSLGIMKCPTHTCHSATEKIKHICINRAHASSS